VHGNGHAAVQHLLAHEITYVSAAGFLCRETRPKMCLVLKLGSKGEAHVADMDAIASQLSSCSMLEGLVSHAVSLHRPLAAAVTVLTCSCEQPGGFTNAIEAHLSCLFLQADFVSRGMWEGAITKGFTKQELAVLKAPLVYAEIMSFIKVRGP
jgi:hypothetical protein